MNSVQRLKLSVVIPAYNEERTLAPLLDRILSLPLAAEGFDLETIVVDDCSRDRTGEIARSYEHCVRVLTNAKNSGKGRTVRNGIQTSTGDIVLVQDADMEYEPEDYVPLLRSWRSLAGENGADRAVVYGSRFLGQIRKWGWKRLTPGKHPGQGVGPWGANLVLSGLTFVLTGRWFTDLLTAYKLYPGRLIREMPTETNGFETDHELTMRLFRAGCAFVEIPIDYQPRSKEEGKKIRAIDFVHAVRTLILYRVKQIT